MYLIFCCLEKRFRIYNFSTKRYVIQKMSVAWTKTVSVFVKTKPCITFSMWNVSITIEALATTISFFLPVRKMINAIFSHVVSWSRLCFNQFSWNQSQGWFKGYSFCFLICASTICASSHAISPVQKPIIGNCYHKWM